jgi:predicted DCC family thiol-disulfide oxidoreductase YuxK
MWDMMVYRDLAAHPYLKKAYRGMQPNHAIVLFDGVCHLCTSTVQFIIKRDPHGYFTFASLQSEIGRTLLEKNGLQPDALETLVLVEGSRCFTRSDAALRVARHLSGGWSLLRVLLLIPKTIRDWGYTVIARNRYRWFGRQEICMVPSRDILDRFLQ